MLWADLHSHVQKVCLREREKMRYTGEPGGNRADLTTWGPASGFLGPGASLVFHVLHSPWILLNQLILFIFNVRSQGLKE